MKDRRKEGKKCGNSCRLPACLSVYLEENISSRSCLWFSHLSQHACALGWGSGSQKAAVCRQETEARFMARHPRQQPDPRLKQTAKTYKEVINVQLRLHKEGKLFFSLSVCESHVRAREDRSTWSVLRMRAAEKVAICTRGKASRVGATRFWSGKKVFHNCVCDIAPGLCIKMQFCLSLPCFMSDILKEIARRRRRNFMSGPPEESWLPDLLCRLFMI